MRSFLQSIQLPSSILIRFTILCLNSLKVNKGKLFSFVTILFFHCPANAQSDSIRQFMDSALALMQQHSMYAKKLNWTNVRDSTFKLAAAATNYTETAPALQYAFDKLGDKHGWLVINDVEYRNIALQPKDNRVSKNMAEAASKGARIYSGVVAGKYAYISVPFFGGQDTTSMNAFAQHLQDSLCSVVTADTKGVILDLRLNAGGNSFPMILGVSNLYGKVPKNKSGTGNYNNWNIESNTLWVNESFHVRLQRGCGDLSHLPVAVLVGPVTGSSGEFIAIGFSTRPKTLLIGERTAGYTTSNNGYLLPGVNNGIVLAEGVAEDAAGKPYPDGIVPALVIPGDNFFNREKDPKVQSAVRWLQKQQQQ
jgi:C-terminal processing protease CtpA/Prc